MSELNIIVYRGLSDEMEKIAAKGPLLGRVKSFLETGRKKGFLIDKEMVQKARKSHGSVRNYVSSPQGRLALED